MTNYLRPPISRTSCAVFTMLLMFASAPVASAIIIGVAADEFDTYIRPADPSTVYQSDLVATFSGETSATGTGALRHGVVQFDLSGVTEPITSVHLNMANLSSGSATFNNGQVLRPASFTRSATWPQDLSTFTWNDYAASIQPVEQKFDVFGSATFPAGQPTGSTYVSFAPASAADVAMFENIRQGDGKITMILKADRGNRDWGDVAHGFATLLYINEAPPTAVGADLRLSINPFTGAATITNPLQTGSLNLDGYTIRSAGSGLNPDPTHTAGVGWDSLTNAAAIGFQEIAPAADALSELNLNGSLTVVSPSTLNLGKPFVPLAARDVRFEYSVAGGTAQSGLVSYVGGLQLKVTKVLGNGGTDLGTLVVLNNPEPVGINIDGYVVRSPDGRLIPAALNGLKDQLGSGWAEIALSPTGLTELNLTGASVIAANSVRSLGAAFLAGGATDLSFRYNLAGGGPDYKQYQGSVVYQQVLRGDANSDKIVNIFDINMVSSQWNTTGPNGDVNFDGIVNIFDINLISSSWNSSIPGAATAVPEPSGLVLLLMGITVGGWALKRRQGPS